jgi:hypothetical protein
MVQVGAASDSDTVSARLPAAAADSIYAAERVLRELKAKNLELRIE